MPDRHLWKRHSTKTIAFTGGAGLGAETSDVTVFTITGRVWAHFVSAFCTEDLISAGGGSIQLGTLSDPDAFVASTTATAIDANEWWGTSVPAAGAYQVTDVNTGGFQTAQLDKLLSEDIILTIGTADITDGTLVIDVIYTPLTDGARLA